MTNLPQRLAEAKERLSQAAQGCLENRPGAAERADAAQAEVDALLRASALHPHCPPGASGRVPRMSPCPTTNEETHERSGSSKATIVRGRGAVPQR